MYLYISKTKKISMITLEIGLKTTIKAHDVRITKETAPHIILRNMKCSCIVSRNIDRQCCSFDEVSSEYVMVIYKMEMIARPPLKLNVSFVS